MLRQVEFLIEGQLLPLRIGELRVSENLFLEAVSPKHLESRKGNYAVAYVGTREEADFFRTAADYLDFFILIYSLVSGQPVTIRMGVGTTLEDLHSLGKRRIGFPDFEKLHVLTEAKYDFLTKPILDAKERFLKLVPDRQKIMESHLGLALIYWYFAVLASRRRLEEAIINLMIASEALLIVKKKKIRSSLSKRLSTLIAKNELERESISGKMRELYDLRSAIVHGRGKKPSFDDVKTLFDYVQRALDRALSLGHLAKEELVEKLDRTEYACLEEKRFKTG